MVLPDLPVGVVSENKNIWRERLVQLIDASQPKKFYQICRFGGPVFNKSWDLRKIIFSGSCPAEVLVQYFDFCDQTSKGGNSRYEDCQEDFEDSEEEDTSKFIKTYANEYFGDDTIWLMEVFPNETVYASELIQAHIV